MKTLISIGIFVAMAAAQGYGHAETTKPSPKKSVVQTTCKDYLAMDEVVKPKFIFYSVGHSTRGKPDVGTFDVVYGDKMVPVINEYCRVHLSASAYNKVMEESVASEKTNR